MGRKGSNTDKRMINFAIFLKEKKWLVHTSIGFSVTSNLWHFYPSFYRQLNIYYKVKYNYEESEWKKKCVSIITCNAYMICGDL